MPFDPADTSAILLYGAGREARSSAAFLARIAPARKLFVTSDDGAPDLPGAIPVTLAQAEGMLAENRIGFIVKSPGVSLYKPFFGFADQQGVSLTSNLNLWGEHFRDRVTVIAITGTKGKSTTATLTHLMLVKSGIDAGLAGNVGVPPLEAADKWSVVVLELSSYQTADMGFAPDLIGITTLSPEHLDWHGSTERYYADKLHLLDLAPPAPVAFGSQAATSAPIIARAIPPTRLVPGLDDDEDDAILDAVQISRLKGAHNLDNARLAARLALAAGAALEGVLDGIAAFEPLPHRLEEHVIGGITFVDDSISTTPVATLAALDAYQGRRIALIVGGHERGQDYDALGRALPQSGVTVLATLPVTGTRAAAAARTHAPDVAVIEEPDLRAAMQALALRRHQFDTLILSPGAPSYNQFRNFEERGAAFMALARDLFSPGG